MIKTARASCHCGAVEFSVKLSDGLKSARRCNCSFCRMRGAIAVTAPLDGVNHPSDGGSKKNDVVGMMRFDKIG